MDFEWNPVKASTNLRKHRVSFEEAATIFGDEFGIDTSDPDHSADENRLVIIGHSNRGRVLLVSYTERNERIRLISARELTRMERKQYEEGI